MGWPARRCSRRCCGAFRRLGLELLALGLAIDDCWADRSSLPYWRCCGLPLDDFLRASYPTHPAALGFAGGLCMEGPADNHAAGLCLRRSSNGPVADRSAVLLHLGVIGASRWACNCCSYSRGRYGSYRYCLGQGRYLPEYLADRRMVGTCLGLVCMGRSVPSTRSWLGCSCRWWNGIGYLSDAGGDHSGRLSRKYPPGPPNRWWRSGYCGCRRCCYSAH